MRFVKTGVAGSAVGIGSRIVTGNAAPLPIDQSMKRNGAGGIVAHRWGRRLIAWGLHRAIGLARSGHTLKALRITRRLTTLAPKVPVVQFYLSRFALALGNTDTAIKALHAALAGSSLKRHNHYCRVAAILLRLNDTDAAEACLETAKSFFPVSPRVWTLLGEFHRYRADTDEAVCCFERSFALARNNEEALGALSGLADCLSDAGRKDDALSVCHRMIELSPDNASAYHILVNCREGITLSDDVTRSMLRLLTSRSLNMPNKMSVHYALGKVYDSCGQYSEAFAHFMVANDYRSRLVRRFDIDRLESDVDARIDIFKSAMISELSKYGCNDDFLICVIGMPRSGTTLTEQILSSHFDVIGLGERPDFLRVTLGLSSRLKSRLPYPQCFTSMSPQVVREISYSVREQLRASAGQHSRVVTKLPGDCWDLGLIKILFPRARFVHCVRNPIDTCLSCFMQNFNDLPYATDIIALSYVYRLYRRIMRHWQQELPVGSIFECCYEQTVSDPEPVVRSLHDFCELPYNEDWSRFPNHVRRVNTASKWQIRRPIYQSSVQKWRNYERFLGPLLPLEDNLDTEAKQIVR